MERSIQVLLLTISMLIGFQPLSAKSIQVAEPSSSLVVAFQQVVVDSSCQEHHDYSYHAGNDYDCTHHNSAVLPLPHSVATTLAAGQPTRDCNSLQATAGSSGHTLPATLARLYGYDYDEDDCFLLLPLSGVAPKNPVHGKPRTGSANRIDGQHGFSDIVDNYASDASRFEIPTKGPGGKVVRTSELYQVEGSLRGDSGIFEWIVDQGDSGRPVQFLLVG